MQAARGASLTPSDSTTGLSVPHWSLFATVAVIGYLVDQLTKAWALETLDDRIIGVIGDWFTLRLVFNPGAAFSTGAEFTIVFTCLSTAAAVTVLFLSRRVASKVWAVGLGALLAGVLGNLTDRVFREPEPFHGHVIDFLSFGDFPVFNVADVLINVAAGVIILQSLRGVSLDGSRDGDDDTPDDPDGADEASDDADASEENP
ncbi:signal peptidase II [Nocardioides daphniae]|uniref:Lipoprotein signal peptidase n=1 Tax=Nocardioides daphniae TaxID=402297 RepID=A0ABQ1QAJ3_9ACTN|nr:signal peptidase II [Nocardioides daphniae]GGD18826.1 lipoprotein signal peptidase [Nocardioides daphniae]